MTDDASGTDKKGRVLKKTETWAEDQQNRGYYYDDATGYEKYEPDADDEEEPDEDRETA